MTDIKTNINKLITKTHFGVYGRIVKNGKILLIKKARGPYTGLYDLPGGSQEKGESYIETLKREIMEETGCKVVRAGNERFKSIIFSDFTIASGEKGVLQHEAILYDVEIRGLLDDIMILAEEYIKYLIRYILKHNSTQIEQVTGSIGFSVMQTRFANVPHQA